MRAGFTYFNSACLKGIWFSSMYSMYSMLFALLPALSFLFRSHPLMSPDHINISAGIARFCNFGASIFGMEISRMHVSVLSQ
jgi:hypothetical protein